MASDFRFGSFATDAFRTRADQCPVVATIATLLFGAAKRRDGPVSDM